MNLLFHKRKSYIEIGEIYFWTATINQWKHLLKKEEFKKIVIQSLNFLSAAGKLDVFSFVIMPNHIHVIWRTNEMNGKETVQGAFLKYTSHEFKKKLKSESPELLAKYAVVANNKRFEFWQRDSLAIHLYTKKFAFQKLNYIHKNPLQPHWELAKVPEEYKYSSARYYETGVKEFEFIKDLREEFI